MTISPKQAILKIWNLMKTNKKKTGFGVLALVLFLVYRYIKKYNKFDSMIEKMTEKFTKQLKDNLQEAERVQQTIATVEEICEHFKSQMNLIKGNLKKDISYLFTIEQMKESLKLKTLTTSDKKSIWENIKAEIMIQACFALTYHPIANLVLLIKEMIVTKYEKLINQKEDNLVIFENFFNAFSEFIIKDGGKNLFVYLRDSLREIYEPLNLTEKHNILSFSKILTKMKNILQQKLDKIPEGFSLRRRNEKNLQHNQSNNNLELDNDTNDMATILISEYKPKHVKKVLKRKAEIEVEMPMIELMLHLCFTKSLKNHSVVIDPSYLVKYLNQSQREQLLSKSVGLMGNESQLEAKLFQSLKSSSSKTDIDLTESKEIVFKNKDEVVNSENKPFLDIFQEAVDEFLDYIESKNFHLYLRYAIQCEFIKLKNRVLLYFQKNKQSEQVLAVLLLPLHKIVNEEFLDPESDQRNELFYNSRIKAGVAGSHSIIKAGVAGSHSIGDTTDLYITLKILKELQMKKIIEKSLFEFGKRVYLEKEYGKFYSKPSDTSGETEDFLNILSEKIGKIA